MSDAAETLETLRFDTDGRRVRFVVDETLYPLDAVFGASYLFVDRCFLFLDRPADKKVEVRLTHRDPAPPQQALEALAGEFANELLNQALRHRIAESTSTIREYVMARAFFSTPVQSSIDQLLAELDEEELAEDDLEIEVPWETE